jgi:hypothetical protein
MRAFKDLGEFLQLLETEKPRFGGLSQNAVA